jgi:hypothetical protein
LGETVIKKEEGTCFVNVWIWVVWWWEEAARPAFFIACQEYWADPPDESSNNLYTETELKGRPVSY